MITPTSLDLWSMTIGHLFAFSFDVLEQYYQSKKTDYIVNESSSLFLSSLEKTCLDIEFMNTTDIINLLYYTTVLLSELMEYLRVFNIKLKTVSKNI